MPSVRTKSGLKHFIIAAAEKRYSFTLNNGTLRMTVPDVAVVTMSREEWLAVVAVFWEAYQDEIRTAGKVDV